jgi:rRNA maturation RNase YbeY
MSGVSIQNMTRGTAPRLPFALVARRVLPGWDISLALVGAKTARALNSKLRGKTYTPNVLSYAAGEKSGEIIICPSTAKREAPSYGMSERVFLLYLFIHGMLHIKGWAHGGRMEKCERDLLAKFAKGSFAAKSNETTHSNRHRHRPVPGKNGRRRGVSR